MTLLVVWVLAGLAFAYDVWAIRTGRATVSTVIRRGWPLVAQLAIGLAAGFVTADHFVWQALP